MDDRQVVDRLQRVRDRIAAACARTGRPAHAVRLVAVSKRIALPLVMAACRAGQWDLGENRVQDALRRQAELAVALTAAGLDPDTVNWHFIGHLQRNKVNKAAGRFTLLHGVDSLDLAARLARRCAAQDALQPILLEVNISGEAQKNGLAPADVADVAARVASLPGVELQGLMGMARHGASSRDLGDSFALLRRVNENARTATGLALPELSMGMSGDYEVAVAEGATIVRIGGAIFGPRDS